MSTPDPEPDSEPDSELARRQEAVTDFRRRWARFVRDFRAARAKDPEQAISLVSAALRDGLPATDGDRPVPPLEVEDDAACAVIAASGYLDAEDYHREHKLRRSVDPVRHFVHEGWQALRAPSLRFDLWAYWAEHLDPTDDSVNPLLHYLLVGRHQGLAPLPAQQPVRPPTRLAADQPPRRACLFAGYDRDGLVDDYVVDLVRELARHADVYYLADGVLEPGQLERLAEHTVGAWSIPHAAYDFGSFSMLARDLVGWEALDVYDEVVLANDSCFLLRPLDDVFADMDLRACDWWSLQATSMEHDESYVADDAPIPLPQAKSRLVGPRHWTDVRYLHLSSYFLAFRRSVLSDPGFRWRLDHVCGQRDKMLVIHKYEVGISRYLTNAGFDFDTYIPELYAFHPLYSRHFFELVERGFPLVKRNFLGENPRHVMDMEAWPERLRALVPQAPIETMQANLARVSPVDRLHEAHDIRLDDDGERRLIPRRAVWGSALRTIDKESPVFGHWWAFVASPGGRLDPGARAVFEEVREDPSIHKVVLSGSRRLDDDLSGERVTVLPIHTVDGQSALVRSRLLLVDREPNVAVNLPLAPSRHDFVHLGIGLPLVPHAASRAPEGEWRKLRAMAVVSQADALVRAAGDPDLPLDKMWRTGLPRHDHLLTEVLPADLAAAETRLRERVGERHLVVWWPHGDPQPRYDADQVAAIADWARRHDVAIGVREPRVDRVDGYTRAFAEHGAEASLVTLSERTVMSPTIVHRVAAAVVTDRSPQALDALVLGTPVVLFDPGTPDAEQDAPQAVFHDEGWPLHARTATVEGLVAELGRVAATGFGRAPVPTAPVGAVPLDGGAAARVARRLRSLTGA